MGDSSARPTFNEVDAWGLTHPGKVRTENQDHFFLGALARGITVEATSIMGEHCGLLHPQRRASLAMVADGVGSTVGGGRGCSTRRRESSRLRVPLFPRSRAG